MSYVKLEVKQNVCVEINGNKELYRVVGAGEIPVTGEETIKLVAHKSNIIPNIITISVIPVKFLDV